MSFFTPDNLRASTAGVWVHRVPEIQLPPDRPADLPLPPLHAPMTGVSTDTRTLKPGNIYFALRGERFDGHAFLAQAAAAGASALVIDDESALTDEIAARASGRGRTQGDQPVTLNGFGVLKVADTGKALLKFAQAYRLSLTRTRVIAVCGSNGKTTTTRLIEHLLRSAGIRGTASPKSFNNAVGVPLTVLSAKPADQFLLCEVGTNAPGEIGVLADVLRPDIAVITSIGREHLEGLGDLAGVAKEEASILWSLNPKGVAVLPSDSPELAHAIRGKRLPTVIAFGRSAGPTAGGAGSETLLQLTDCRHLTTTRIDPENGARTPEFVLAFTVNKRQEYTLGLPGDHNALNALAAIAVARRFNVDDGKLASALAGFRAPEMRMQTRSLAGPDGSITLILDCYNANPDSVLSAIRTLAALTLPSGAPGKPTAGRRVAILGDMLELGRGADELHAQIGASIAELPGKGIELVIFVGEHMRHAADALASAGWPASRAVHLTGIDSGEHRDAVARLLRAGDLVLVKGSRRMELERLIPAIGRSLGGDLAVEIETTARPRAAGVV